MEIWAKSRSSGTILMAEYCSLHSHILLRLNVLEVDQVVLLAENPRMKVDCYTPS